MDLCFNIESTVLREEAIRMLGKPGFLFRLTGSQPLGPIKKKSTTLAIFLSFFVLCFTIEVLFTFPHMDY